uniref:Uncharacterized protein n=1 Tax=Chlorobium phaeobacteroides (strain BS1) TaxID=331678 RepID=B3EJK3_CHLPB
MDLYSNKYCDFEHLERQGSGSAPERRALAEPGLPDSGDHRDPA